VRNSRIAQAARNSWPGRRHIPPDSGQLSQAPLSGSSHAFCLSPAEDRHCRHNKRHRRLVCSPTTRYSPVQSGDGSSPAGLNPDPAPTPINPAALPPRAAPATFDPSARVPGVLVAGPGPGARAPSIRLARGAPAWTIPARRRRRWRWPAGTPMGRRTIGLCLGHGCQRRGARQGQHGPFEQTTAVEHLHLLHRQATPVSKMIPSQRGEAGAET
jgi:hypothetical protein